MYIVYISIVNYKTPLHRGIFVTTPSELIMQPTTLPFQFFSHRMTVSCADPWVQKE